MATATTAEITAKATETTRVLTEDVVKVVTEAITKSAETAYATIRDNISADIRSQIETAVVKQLRGKTLFKGCGQTCDLPKIDGVTYLRDEYVIIDFKPNSNAGSYYITNYGRCIRFLEQKRAAGRKLTDEIIWYVYAVNTQNSLDCDETLNVIVAILDAYDNKFALATNTVHDDKIAAIRKEIKTEFAAEQTKLDATRAELTTIRDANTVSAQLNQAQHDLLEAERAEHKRAKAVSAAHEKTHAELMTATRQVELIKAQLAKQALRLRDREAELTRERKRLEALKRELDDRASMLSLDLDNVLVDSDDTESSDEIANP